MSRNAWLLTGGLVVCAVWAAQFKAISGLRSELAALRAEINGGAESDPAPLPVRALSVSAPRSDTTTLHARLAGLERTVADLSQATDALIERGMIPPSEERLAQMQRRFFDPSASDGDRLRALRLIRRNRQVSDDVLVQAMGFLQSTTNNNTRRELLRQLDGVTNAAFKQPLLSLLQTEIPANVREEVVDALSEFADDPAVEDRLWKLALNEADEDVREEAQDALTEGRMTPERIQRLHERAASPDASIDERLLALRGLREADVESADVVADMAQLAHNTSDPVTRAKLFDAFDGINDPSVMAPLVYGLQDPNPVVRQNAADALSSFSGDPRIQEWLNHVIQTDADPRVKREAHQALEQQQRRERGGR